MSGCAHCVWDDYREDVEQWAVKLEEARAKLAAKHAGSGPAAVRHGPGVFDGSHSMDDDGGGSETNWTLPSEDGLFADIPVGIREFMKTEKKLRIKRQRGREEHHREREAVSS